MFLLANLRTPISFITRTFTPSNVTNFQIILRAPPATIRHHSGLTKIGQRLVREARYMQKDRVPDGFHIIYRAPMHIYVNLAHHFSTVSALLVSSLAVYVALYGTERLQAPFAFETDYLISDKEDIKYFAAGFILLTLGMRYIVMRYPHRIYRNEKQYIAILEGRIPFTHRRIQFKKGEVTEVKPFGIMPWKEAWYRIRNQKVLLLIDYFKTPSELFTMMLPEES